MNTPPTMERYLELLADEQLGQLSVEDGAELEQLRDHFGDPGHNTLGELLLAIDRVLPQEQIPAELAARITARGRAIVGAGPAGAKRARLWITLAIAASLLAAASIAFTALEIDGRRRAASQWESRLAELQDRLNGNEALLADSRRAVADLQTRLAEADGLTEQQKTRIADAAQREVDLAQRLADATSRLAEVQGDLDDAQLRIARLEAPADPAQLAADRKKLLEVPGTIRLGWSPFDLPDAPAEQHDVQGDVVWNDDRQEGYLRFVGLQPNDPAVEQYQVWVIDERGMEQKVSGGVFNATAQGEVIVPIHPGIDVGRVALFAVTIEEPGGIWVPDLKRRVVVAPRDEG